MNEAKLSLIDMLNVTNPMLYERAGMRWSADEGNRVPVEPNNPRQELFTVVRNGVPEHYYISKRIAAAYPRPAWRGSGGPGRCEPRVVPVAGAGARRASLGARTARHRPRAAPRAR